MICLRCDNELFVPGEAKVEQRYKGKDFQISTSVMVCKSCGWFTVGIGQTDELVRRTKDAYEGGRAQARLAL